MSQYFLPSAQVQVVRFFSLIMPHRSNHVRQQEAAVRTRHHQMPSRSRRTGQAQWRWKARRPWCAPLKSGLAGLTSRHQTTGRVRVFATADTWRTQRPRGASGLGGLRQGIIRCRAEAGGQGCLCGDGKPVGPDVPPWKWGMGEF